MDLNKVMIIGNMTRDPETRTTSGGQTVCTFSLATNLRWTDAAGQKQVRPEYHNIVAWRKLADLCGQYLTRGRKVYIEGRLQTREWTGQDGILRRRTEIVADQMIILDSRPAVSQNNYASAGVPVAAQTAPRPTPVMQEGSFAGQKPVVSRPVEPVMPSVSLEEPAESVSPMPQQVPPQEMNQSASVTTTISEEKEEIRVEDIPF